MMTNHKKSKKLKRSKKVPDDVKNINVAASSKSKGGKSEKITSLPRESSTGKACILRVSFCEEATQLSTK
jgi:hypothetical protein